MVIADLKKTTDQKMDKTIQAFKADLAKVRQHVADGPVVLDGHILGCHPPPDGILGVAKQVGGDLPLFRREEIKELLRHCPRQLLQQCRAIIG